MALTKCNECGKEVSDMAGKCPHCGAVLLSRNKIGCAVLFGIFVIVGVIGVSLKDNSPQPTKAHQEMTIQKKIKTKKETDKAPTALFNSANETISVHEYGKEWPFTVSSGVLACSGAGAVTFTVIEKTYAVNGLALSDGSYFNIREIWKNDYESEHAQYMIKQGRLDLVPKISLGPIIDRGLKLCE